MTLDGAPENLALGASLVESASLELLVAIFFSNLPEVRQARRHRTWVPRRALLTFDVGAGRALTEPLSQEHMSVALGFAAGGVLASLADTHMPRHTSSEARSAFGDKSGFFLAFVLSV